MDENGKKRIKNSKRSGSFAVRTSTNAMIQRRKKEKGKPRKTPQSTPQIRTNHAYEDYHSYRSNLPIWPFVCNFTGAGLQPSIPSPPSPWSSFVFSKPSPSVSPYTFEDTRMYMSSAGVERWLQNGGIFPTTLTPSPSFFISSARRDVVDSDDDDDDDKSDDDLLFDDNNDDDDDDGGHDNVGGHGSGSGNGDNDRRVYPRASLDQMERRRIIRVHRPHAMSSTTAAAELEASLAALVAMPGAAASRTAVAMAAVPTLPSSTSTRERMERRRILRVSRPDAHAAITTTAPLLPPSSSSSSRIAVNPFTSSPGVAITVTITTTSTTTSAPSVATSATTSTLNSTALNRNPFSRNLPSTSSSSSSSALSSSEVFPPRTGSASATTGSTQKVGTVEQEMDALRQKVRLLEQANQRQCVICLENPKNVVLSPCNHLCICQDCSARVVRTCPICRSIIKKRTVVYL